MYLLILESIGTSELILIAVVALIVFGPRKLPQMVKTIGKTMGEFRSATNEFKSTWAREAALDDDLSQPQTTSPSLISVNGENSISRNQAPIETTAVVSTPQVKELSAEDAARIFRNRNVVESESTESRIDAVNQAPGKRDWL